MAQKNDDRLTLRLPAELRVVLSEIEQKHRIGEAEIARGCLEAVAAFYKEHGFFAFPVRVWPEEEFLKAAAAAQIIDTDAPDVRAAKRKAPRSA